MKPGSPQAAKVNLSPEIPFSEQSLATSDSSFECQEIITQFQTEKWLDDPTYWLKGLNNPTYWLVYHDIWQEQNEVIQLAENLRMLTRYSTPDDRSYRSNNSVFKVQITAFAAEHSKALDGATYQQETAYVYKLADANTLRQKESIEWHFFLPAQISLGIIYLREYQQRSHTQTKTTVELRNLIKDWQKDHNKKSASDNGQWNRAFTKRPVTRLLPA